MSEILEDSVRNSLPAQHAVNFFQYCPHCGSSHFHALSVKEFKCADCGFNFFPNSAAAVACIIVDSQGRVMLSRRARNPWKGLLDLPGGFVDPGESIEQAVARELHEELGANIVDYRYLCSFPNKYIFSGYEVCTIDLAFICHVSNVSSLAPADDINGIEWYTVNSLPIDDIPAVSIRNILKEYQRLNK